MPVPPLRKLTIDELDRASLAQYRLQAKLPLVAVLDNLRSLHNVGAIFRSADAFALQHLHLCGFTGTPPHPDIHRSALGSTDSVSWQHHPRTADCLRQLRAAGYLVLALEQTTASVPLDRIATLLQPRRPVALLLGNEVKGVADEALALCDAAVDIPQYGTKHSLNVAVAAGIAMYALATALRADQASSGTST